MNNPSRIYFCQPYKSVAIALLFTLLLGPLGLLYSSFWGGLFMLPIGILLMRTKFLLGVFLFWIACCIWSVKSVEDYNQRMYHDQRSSL